MDIIITKLKLIPCSLEHHMINDVITVIKRLWFSVEMIIIQPPSIQQYKNYIDTKYIDHVVSRHDICYKDNDDYFFKLFGNICYYDYNDTFTCISITEFGMMLYYCLNNKDNIGVVVCSRFEKQAHYFDLNHVYIRNSLFSIQFNEYVRICPFITPLFYFPCEYMNK